MNRTVLKTLSKIFTFQAENEKDWIATGLRPHNDAKIRVSRSVIASGSEVIQHFKFIMNGNVLTGEV